MPSEWRPIETAPRDGTEVILTWMEDGEPQEQWPMVWDTRLKNPLVQAGAGIWVVRTRDGRPEFTWSEANPAGAPTHWRPLDAE